MEPKTEARGLTTLSKTLGEIFRGTLEWRISNNIGINDHEIYALLAGCSSAGALKYDPNKSSIDYIYEIPLGKSSTLDNLNGSSQKLVPIAEDIFKELGYPRATAELASNGTIASVNVFLDANQIDSQINP